MTPRPQETVNPAVPGGGNAACPDTAGAAEVTAHENLPITAAAAAGLFHHNAERVFGLQAGTGVLPVAVPARCPAALVTWMMVTENPGPVISEALMPGCPPDLCASRHAARHLEVTAARSTAGRAVASFPGDRDTARQPGMVTPAFQRKAGPRKDTFLLHGIIQT